MDIHRWLQDTTNRAPPSDTEDPPPAFQDPPSVAGSLDKKYRRKRRRRASDSSIIAPQIPRQHSTRHHQKTTHELLGRSRRTRRNASESGSESWRGSSRGSTREVDSNVSAKLKPATTYERRARHKTKADRYDPKSSRRKKPKQKDEDQDRGREGKRRKSHRSGDGKRTAGLVQSFQLKNGPKNQRLTLNQDATTGMFKHGRASAQTTGKRNGLPDLVFNEMKFLQRSNEHQDENAQEDTARKPTAKDRKRRAENDEISAYFDTSKGLPEQTTTINHRLTGITGDADVKTHKVHRGLHKHQSSGPKLPPETLAQIPLLPFSSRGVLAQSSQAQRTATPLTWTESIPRQVSVQAKDPEFKYHYPSTMENAHSRVEGPIVEGQGTQKHHDESNGPVKRGQWVPSEYARRSARVEVYQSTDFALPTRRRDTASHTSLSLPRLSRSGTNHANVQRGETGFGAVSSTRSYGTSDILRVRTRMRALADHSSARSVDRRSGVNDKENSPSPSLSPTTKLLDTAQTALLPDSSHVRRHTLADPHQGRFGTTNFLPYFHPQDRFPARTGAIEEAFDWTGHRYVPGRPGSRTYQDVLRPVAAGFVEPTLPPEPTTLMSSLSGRPHIWTRSLSQLAPTDPGKESFVIDDDDEMLLDYHDRVFNEHDPAPLQAYDSIDHDGTPQDFGFSAQPSMEAYDNDHDHRAVPEEFQWPQANSTLAGMNSDFTPAMARRMSRGQPKAGNSAAEDAMGDFWRPNRLY